MQPLVKKIENSNTQTVIFRGYIKQYDQGTTFLIWCEGIHKTYADAERSAKKLLKKIRSKNKENGKEGSH